MAVSESRGTAYTNCLRLSVRDEAEILAALDRGSASAAGRDRRRQTRVPYERRAGLIVQMHHPGGSIENYLVRVRNLSTGGVGFLHGSFVYTGTYCVMTLLTINNRAVRVEGKVVRCRHVRKHVHEIGVRFDEPIDLHDFVASALTLQDGLTDVSKQLPQFGGLILHVEDSVNDQELLAFHLGNVGVKVKAVSNVLAAIEVAEQIRFDAVLASVCLGAMSGLDLSEFLRQNGYQGPIVALTAEDSEDVRKDALQRGCSAVLVKPYGFEALLALLEPHLPSAKAPAASIPMASELWGDQRMRPLIRAFLTRLRGQVTEMGRLLQGCNWGPGLRKFCLDIKGSAGGYGFPRISVAAQEVVDLITSEASPDRLKGSIAALVDLSRSACTMLDQGPAADAPAGAPAPRSGRAA